MAALMVIAKILIISLEFIFTGIQIVVNIIVGKLSDIRVGLYRDYDYRRWLKRDLADCENILELGCGSNSPILQIGYGKKTDTVDIWQPYIDKHRREKDYAHCWPENVLIMAYPEKQYDAVVICDVMEHLDRDSVIKNNLFSKMENCARKKVIIFAPNGFVENDKVDGDPYQEHVSAWEPGDYLRRGYTVKGATGLRYILGKASLPKYRPHSFFSIIAMASQPWIFNRPEKAWHSYSVKELK